MELVTRQVNEAQPASIVYGGRTDLALSAGRTLKIETGPKGEEVLSVVVPKGKAWAIAISVEVVETDV